MLCFLFLFCPTRRTIRSICGGDLNNKVGSEASLGTLGAYIGPDGARLSMRPMAAYEKLKTRRRDDYAFILEYRTRWSDNDQ